MCSGPVGLHLWVSAPFKSVSKHLHQDHDSSGIRHEVETKITAWLEGGSAQHKDLCSRTGALGRLRTSALCCCASLDSLNLQPWLCYINQAGFKLRPTGLCLPSASTKGVQHHTRHDTFLQNKVVIINTHNSAFDRSMKDTHGLYVVHIKQSLKFCLLGRRVCADAKTDLTTGCINPSRCRKHRYPDLPLRL